MFFFSFFSTQFGKKFVQFVFLGAHVSAVSLLLSRAATALAHLAVYVIGFTLCIVSCTYVGK